MTLNEGFTATGETKDDVCYGYRIEGGNEGQPAATEYLRTAV